MKSANQELPQLATKKDAAFMLNLSISSIEKLMRDKKLPYSKLDGAVRFEKYEIENFINKNKISSKN